MQVIVTAGPTVEDIDDVRFVSNRSSGRLGYAIAGQFAVLGHEVTLVSGPVCLEPPAGVERASVRSADEMADAVFSRLEGADIVVMAAAVADFKPTERISGKIKKSGAGLTLHLVETADILAGIGKRRPASQTVVGFALEAGGTDDPAARDAALDKMAAKMLDAIVLNGPGNIGADSGKIVILSPGGDELAQKSGSKTELAETIVDTILAIHKKRRPAE